MHTRTLSTRHSTVLSLQAKQHYSIRTYLTLFCLKANARCRCRCRCGTAGPSEDSCCPDGLDCVLSGRRFTCKWTGRAIVPPAGYVTSQKQKTPRGKPAAAAPDSTQEVPEDISVNDIIPQHIEEIIGAIPRCNEATGRRLSQAVCVIGALCPNTTLVPSGQPTCNTAGAQA